MQVSHWVFNNYSFSMWEFFWENAEIQKFYLDHFFFVLCRSWTAYFKQNICIFQTVLLMKHPVQKVSQSYLRSCLWTILQLLYFEKQLAKGNLWPKQTAIRFWQDTIIIQFMSRWAVGENTSSSPQHTLNIIHLMLWLLISILFNKSYF